MTFTKEMVKENEEMFAMAKKLLTIKGEWVVDTDVNQHPDVVNEIAKKFPQVNRDRVIYRVVVAIRSLKGAEVRKRRGAPIGNRNAAKDESKKMWSSRFALRTIALIARNAEVRGMSQTAYVEWLVRQDRGRIV